MRIMPSFQRNAVQGEDFSQTIDEEVRELVARAAQRS